LGNPGKNFEETANAFHEGEKVQQAKQQRLPDQIADIPTESEPLEGLGKVNQDLIRFGERCPEQKMATVDQDDYREPQTRSTAHLRRAARLAADAGYVGGDGRGAGG
jgi:hypothetical protein